MPTPRYDYGGARGLEFNAVLYGSPNVAGLAGVKGMRTYTSRFDKDGRDRFFSQYMQDALLLIGAKYTGHIEDEFTKKHGRTGETAGSIRDGSESYAEPGVAGGAGAFVYRITMGGNVGFVVNPLPTHTVPFVPEGAPNGPFTGRQDNFYSPASGVKSEVEWFQGGDESYSPDTSWFDQDTGLADDAYAELAQLAARVRLMWGAQNGTLIPLTAPSLNPGPVTGPYDL